MSKLQQEMEQLSLNEKEDDFEREGKTVVCPECGTRQKILADEWFDSCAYCGWTREGEEE